MWMVFMIKMIGCASKNLALLGKDILENVEVEKKQHRIYFCFEYMQ